MTQPSGEGGLVLRLSSALYRLLLLRYPADFRRAYGEEMVDVFEAEVLRTLVETGVSGMPALWWKVARDLGRPLPGPVGAESTRRRSGNTSWSAGAREDLVFAARSLRREPRFTAMVVAVLGVGLGLNVVAFTAINAYLLRPLPFPEAERIVTVQNVGNVSWRDVDDVFEAAVSYDLDVFTIIGDGRPEMVPGAWTTPGFMATYGIQPQLGRTFLPEEAGRYGSPVAMISHRLWQQRFGGDPDIVGRSFSAFTSDRPDHAEAFTIVGVLAADFWYMNEYTEVLSPLREDRSVYAGRLRTDVSPDRAAALLTDKSLLGMERVPEDFAVTVTPLQERHVAAVRPTLMVVQAAVLLVLLIACANAAVMLLVRSTRREQELGLRRALGALGPRLARQLLFEGGLIASCAAALGFGLSALTLTAARAGIEARLGLTVPGGLESLDIDGTVLVGTLALTLVVGLVFGAVPLLSALPKALRASMGDASRGGTESRGRRRARNTMVAAEVALSLSLLVGAGLMVRSALHLQYQDLGFHPAGVVRAQMGLRQATYPAAADRVMAFERLRESLAQMPGVEDVGLVSMGLFSTRFTTWETEGQDPDGVSRAEAVRWLVDERYFDVLGIEIVRGRPLDASDGLENEPVAVISARLAQHLFGDEDALGKSVRLAAFDMPGMPPEEPDPWARVVGVVADIHREVAPDPVGDLYLPYRQVGPAWMSAMVRFRGSPGPFAVALDDAVGRVDPDVPLSSVGRLDETVAAAMKPTRDFAVLLVGFSAFALVLAIFGLYGVISYAARQRQRIIAIRIALGADRASVVTLFLREGLTVVAAGVVLGTVGGVLLGRALETQLFGVRPGDPMTHIILAGAMAAGAAAAVWVPARQAARTDPMAVLRGE